MPKYLYIYPNLNLNLTVERAALDTALFPWDNKMTISNNDDEEGSSRECSLSLSHEISICCARARVCTLAIVLMIIYDRGRLNVPRSELICLLPKERDARTILHVGARGWPPFLFPSHSSARWLHCFSPLHRAQLRVFKCGSSLRTARLDSRSRNVAQRAGHRIITDDDGICLCTGFRASMDRRDRMGLMIGRFID